MRIIVGVTGASGVEMSYYLLRALKNEEDCEIHLVISAQAKINWELETNRPLDDLLSLADTVYDTHNLAATISSGSYQTDGMIIMPCSMKTLAGITTGYTDDLIIRAADVCMKEGRKVVLVPREMPLGKVHLRNMKEAADLGCVIIPPVLTFYNGAKTMEEQIDHVVGKVLMQFGLRYRKFVPWTGADKA
jgi:polyprenyl P-hydroxybenzoate and phenylacrylic acid decarboxylases